MTEKTDKTFRLLQLHERLSRGEAITKAETIQAFGIPPKTFQRDIESLRLYYSEQHGSDLFYDKKSNSYRLAAQPAQLTKKEVFAICKVLIESRAFNRDEFDSIIGKCLKQCEAEDAKTVKALIANEQVNYIPLQHGKPLVDIMWELAECVTQQRIIRFSYIRKDGIDREHDVKPVGIMFSEFYFYLIAFLADDRKGYPTVFRIDRIGDLKKLDKKFSVPYAKKFSEAEFRKRVQFMYSGELRTVRFKFKGNLEAVLDRLPTARVVETHEDGVVVSAEVFGTGIDMWLKSQGERVEMVKG
jgi:predicted DNA-binding transcriptional regulator YafY